jgi:hypothetical protein
MNNYIVTYFRGDRESQVEIHNVKKIAYDKDVVIFFDVNDEAKFVLKYDKYFIGKI